MCECVMQEFNFICNTLPMQNIHLNVVVIVCVFLLLLFVPQLLVLCSIVSYSCVRKNASTLHKQIMPELAEICTYIKVTQTR